jgi:hypothetical protein
MSQPTLRDVLQGIGGLQEGQKRVDGRLKKMEENIEDIQKAHTVNTTQIALINQRCDARGKMISNLDKSLYNAKLNGVTQVVQKDTAIKIVKWVGGGMIAITGIVIGLLKVFL